MSSPATSKPPLDLLSRGRSCRAPDSDVFSEFSKGSVSTNSTVVPGRPPTPRPSHRTSYWAGPHQSLRRESLYETTALPSPLTSVRPPLLPLPVWYTFCRYTCGTRSSPEVEVFGVKEVTVSPALTGVEDLQPCYPVLARTFRVPAHGRRV